MPAIPQYARTYNRETRRWDTDALQELDAEEWAEWIEKRVTGRDRWFAYGRGEAPGEAAVIFRGIARTCYRDKDIDLPAARQGAERMLEDFDPQAQSEDITVNLMYAAEYLARPESDEGADTVARWITERRLLGESPDDSDHRLNRMALFCLALLQKRGAEHHSSLWESYFQKSSETGDPYFYVTAGFTGKTLGTGTLDSAAKDVVKLLRLYNEAKEEGHHFPASAGLRGFWDHWLKAWDLRGTLVRCFREEEDGRELWETLCRLTVAPPNLESFSYETQSSAHLNSPRGAWTVHDVGSAGRPRILDSPSDESESPLSGNSTGRRGPWHPRESVA